MFTVNTVLYYSTCRVQEDHRLAVQYPAGLLNNCAATHIRIAWTLKHGTHPRPPPPIFLSARCACTLLVVQTPGLPLSALTVPSQRPLSALTVPSQCPHSALTAPSQRPWPLRVGHEHPHEPCVRRHPRPCGHNARPEEERLQATAAAEIRPSLVL